MLFDPFILTLSANSKAKDSIVISPAMKLLNQNIHRIAGINMPVLIESEPGNSSELAAKAIHEYSLRSDKLFHSFYCTGCTEYLMERELFGYTNDASEDSNAIRKGLFQLADKGTLLLCEIEDMPLGIQAKLLRYLEEGIIFPVGSSSVLNVDVRVICSTNHLLRELVDNNKFRKDLYLYIKGINIKLPPLRERRQDIPELFGYFLKEACKNIGRDIHLITDRVMLSLMAYSWPGNVRQLQSVVRTMVALSDKDILEIQDLPPDISQLNRPEKTVFNEMPSREFSQSDYIHMSLEDVEREHICRILKSTGNNRSEAARILKIGERTLYRKIKEYKL